MSTAPNVMIIPAKVQTAESRRKYHQLRVAASGRTAEQLSGPNRILYRSYQQKKGMDACGDICRRGYQRNADKEKNRV